MRILTPIEQRSLEDVINHLRKVYGDKHEDLIITIDHKSAEAWLNVFQLALSANEDMTQLWRKSYKGVTENV